MAPAQVIYNTPSTSDNPQSSQRLSFPGTLFEGLKFFILQRCPTRSAFANQIRINGGEVIPLEKQADYIIGDHVRRDSPPGSVSYTFIEQSLRDGRLANPGDHPAGPTEKVVREAGSVARPMRKKKVPFTAEDDRILYTWVKECQSKGGRALGNAIFMQLEDMNQRHTWQSWRDRYVKYLQHKPPAMCYSVNQVENGQSNPSEVGPILDRQQHPVGAEEPMAQNPTSTTSRSSTGTAQQHEPGMSLDNGKPKAIPGSNGLVANKVRDKYDSFTREDFDYLLKEAEDILNVSYGGFDKAWQDYVEYYQKHSTWDVWRDFFQEKVLPVYREMTAAQIGTSRQEQGQDEGLFVDQQEDGTSSDMNAHEKRGIAIFEEPAERTTVPMNGSPNFASPAHPFAESPERSDQGSERSPKVIDPLTRKRTRSPESSSQSNRSSPAEKRQRIDYSQRIADEMQEVEESDPEGRNGVILTPKQHTVMPSIVESIHNAADDQGSVHPSEELGEQIQKEGFVDVNMDMTINTTETYRQDKLQESRYSHTTVSELRRQAQTRSIQMSSSAEPDSSPPVHSDRTISMERDTQAILNAATQAVDFDIPSPLVEREEDEGDEGVKAVRDEEAEVVEDEMIEEAAISTAEEKVTENAETNKVLRGKEEYGDGEGGETEENEGGEEDEFAPQGSSHLATHETGSSVGADIDIKSANQDRGRDKDSDEDENEESEYQRENTVKPQPSTRDTQALLAANTQIIDFEVPEPFGGFAYDLNENDKNYHDIDDTIEPEKPNSTSSQNNTHTNGDPISHPAKKKQSPLSLSASELDDQINSFINAGFAESDIISAMKCTSLDLQLTARILPLLDTRKHIPEDMRGVWTAEDDKALEGGDGRSIKRVAEKHGWAACDVRLRFLDEWRG